MCIRDSQGGEQAVVLIGVHHPGQRGLDAGEKGGEHGADEQDIEYIVVRFLKNKEDSPLLVLDGCTIDFSRAEVHKGSETISLTAKEHTLLETLARNAGKIVTVDSLCEALWGDNPFGLSLIHISSSPTGCHTCFAAWFCRSPVW